MTSWGVWYTSRFFVDPHRLPHGCTVNISNIDFSRAEATYLLYQFLVSNNIPSLHFNRDSGVGTVTFPNGHTVCVYVAVQFTAKVGERRISIHLPPVPGGFNASIRIRTDDRNLFGNAKSTTVIL
ncbi:MAG: hypothetical protein WCT27_04905 [Patescibacteria group bacterium]